MSMEFSGILKAVGERGSMKLSELIENIDNPGELARDLLRQWYIGAIIVSNETVFTEMLNHTISLRTFAMASDDKKREHLQVFAQGDKMSRVIVGRARYYGMPFSLGCD